MLAGLPVTERRVSAGGTSTTVLEAGGGPPLVLLHGGIECGGAYWAPVITQLAERHRVVIPDVPGLGASEPLDDLGAEAFAGWLHDLLQITGTERPTLVAHSLVGTLAARFAARDASALRRLVIYGSPGVGRYRMPIGLLITAIRFDLHPSERNAERFERWAFFDFDDARRRDGDWLAAFSEYTRSRANVPHVKQTIRRLIASCTKQVAEAELRRIAVPTELVWGRHDRFVPLALAEAASTRLGWPLRVVEHSGHVPHIERPDHFLEGFS